MHVASARVGRAPSASGARTARTSAPPTSGTSPLMRRTRSAVLPTAERPTRAASPVPRWCSCTAVVTARPAKARARYASTTSRPCPTTTTTSSHPASKVACTTWCTMGRPHTACITFASALFIRVPCPAARTIAVIVDIVSPSRIAVDHTSMYPRHRLLSTDRIGGSAMRTRPWSGRVSLLIPLCLGAAAVACNDTFDTSRTLPPRGTLGAELYGVVCDRLGGQSLHEDLTGTSYAGICHVRSDGTYADKVDPTLLPPMVDGQLDVNGKPVPLAQQQTDRTYWIARLETLATHRKDLIAALDATFPDIQIPIKDLGNADPTKSCNAPQAGGEGRLHDELSNLLGRMQALYDDGTIPQSTESLGRVITAFKASTEAQKAWSHFDARAGYRPIDIARVE